MNKKPFLLLMLFALVGLMFLIGFFYSPSVPFKPNFLAIASVGARQDAFIKFMTPKIQYANQQIIDTRARILSILIEWQTSGYLSKNDAHWLSNVAYVYQIKGFNVNNDEDIHELLLRVDSIPTNLVLAQAANESAWGTSRFAIHADNFFGQHCSVPGCGIPVRSSHNGTVVEVQKFKNVQDAVTNYLYNINTNSAYSNFRNVRYQMRLNGDKKLSGFRLAPSLSRYSSLGQDYVTRIQDMIANLNKYDAVHVKPLF